MYGYYDSSFADCPDTKRSTGGHCIYWWGCLIAWVSKINRFVHVTSSRTCTIHSEYVAGATCARECAFQINLATELKMNITLIDLFSDSMGGIAQTYNPINTNRAATKHIDVADHYLREQVPGTQAHARHLHRYQGHGRRHLHDWGLAFLDKSLIGGNYKSSSGPDSVG